MPADSTRMGFCFSRGENSERAVFPAGDARSTCDPADGRRARLLGEEENDDAALAQKQSKSIDL